MLRRTLLAFSLSAGLLAGCGDPPPATPVDDPRAYLVEALRTAELRTWWEPYADRRDEFLGTAVDQLAQALPDGLPEDSRRLDRLVPQAVGRFRTLSLSEEHRDHLMRAAEARFADPPMALIEGRIPVALLDFHHLPGEWKSIARAGDAIKDSPAIAGLGEFEHRTLVRALVALSERFPDAYRLQVRARYFHGASRHGLVVQVDRDGDILVRAGTRTKFTAEPVAFDALLAGEVRLDELEWERPMEGNSGPGFTNAHPDPLPAR